MHQPVPITRENRPHDCCNVASVGCRTVREEPPERRTGAGVLQRSSQNGPHCAVSIGTRLLQYIPNAMATCPGLENDEDDRRDTARRDGFGILVQ